MISTCLVGVFILEKERNMEHRGNPYRDVKKVIFRFNDEIKRDYQVINTSYGIDFFRQGKKRTDIDGKVHLIGLSYRYEKLLSNKEARTLFYNLTDRLLEIINNNENVKGYFRNYPLTYDDVDVCLSFRYNDGNLPPGSLRIIHAADDEIFYAVVETPEFTEMTTAPVSPGVDVVTNYENHLTTVWHPIEEDLALNDHFEDWLEETVQKKQQADQIPKHLRGNS
jgi:hypothetical protein